SEITSKICDISHVNLEIISLISQEALWNTVKSCWDNLGHQVLHELVDSMPAGVHAVIKAKGGRYSEIYVHFSKIQLFTQIFQMTISFVMKNLVLNS
ncbi:hypothetical protein LDENG_00284260, partial [Lucifuga dentata]